jgi:hypothetical protein
MPSLQDKLLTPANRPSLIRDCGRLVDEEVDKKSGLTGLAIKAAFRTVKAVKPGFIEHVIDGLLDEWVAKLDGHFQRYVEAGSQGTFGAFASKDASAVAEKLLEVTDGRAHKVEHKTVATLYQKLRPNAKDHVVTSVPGLGRVVDKYL